MRRIVSVFGLSMVLVSATSGAFAQNQPINITGEMRGSEVLVDLTLRDAEIAEVLIALFNTTNGQYEAEISPDVTGRVPLVSLRQLPFDQALRTILGSNFSFTSKDIGNGIRRYVISRGQTSSGTGLNPVGRPVPLNSGSTDATSLTAVREPIIPQNMKRVATSSASESSVVEFIGINYISLSAVVSVFGGEMIDLYGGGTGSSGVRNNTQNTNTNVNNKTTQNNRTTTTTTNNRTTTGTTTGTTN